MAPALGVCACAESRYDRPVAAGIRNSWAKLALRRIRALTAERRDAALAMITAETQAIVGRESAGAFLDAARAVEVCDAVAHVLPPAQALEFWTSMVHDSYVGGLLQPLANVARLGEMDRRLVELAPEAWRLSSRECGTIQVSVTGGARLSIVGEDMPPIVRDSLGIQQMFGGAVRAMLNFGRARAKLSLLGVTDDKLGYEVDFRPGGPSNRISRPGA